MERLPFDIIINHIIPYTYSIQPRWVLDDIRNYYTIKKLFLDNAAYNTDVIKRELLSVLYLDKKLYNILSRRFPVHPKQQYNRKMLSKYSTDTKFNMLFGLFTPDERVRFSQHISVIYTQ